MPNLYVPRWCVKLVLVTPGRGGGRGPFGRHYLCRRRGRRMARSSGCSPRPMALRRCCATTCSRTGACLTGRVSMRRWAGFSLPVGPGVSLRRLVGCRRLPCEETMVLSCGACWKQSGTPLAIASAWLTVRRW